MPEMRISSIFFSPSLDHAESIPVESEVSVGKQGKSSANSNSFWIWRQNIQLWLQLTMNQPHLKLGSKDLSYSEVVQLKG